MEYLGDTDRNHLDGSDRVIVASWNLGDLFNKIVSLNDFSKDRVSRRTAVVEPIQKGVVVDIDEELRTYETTQNG